MDLSILRQQVHRISKGISFECKMKLDPPRKSIETSGVKSKGWSIATFLQAIWRNQRNFN